MPRQIKKLHRISLIKKAMLQTEFFGQMFSQRLNTETLGSVMSGGDEGHAGFIGEMKILLGNFSGDVGIHALCNRRFEITLRRAAAPRHFAYALVTIADD